MVFDLPRTLALFALLTAIPNCANAQAAPPANEGGSSQNLEPGLRVSDELVAQFADPALTGCPISGGGVAFFEKGVALSVPSMFSSNDATRDGAINLMLTHWDDKSVTWEFVGGGGKCAVEITVRLKAAADGKMSYEPLRVPVADPAH